MPSERGSQFEQKLNQENPVERQREHWQAIIEKIKHIEPNLGDVNRTELLMEILGNSTKDGLEVARILGVGKEIIKSAILSPKFLVKKEEVALELERSLLASSLQPEALKFGRDLLSAINRGQKSEEGYRNSWRFAKAVKNRAESLGESIYEDIDKYYAEFLPTRKVKAAEQEDDKRSPGERIGERLFHKMERALEEQYYAGPVLDFIWVRMPKEYKKIGLSRNDSFREFLKSKAFSDAAIDEVLRADFLEQWEATSLVGSVVGVFPEELRKSVYKMPGELAMVEQKLAVKTLKKELEQSVGEHYPNWELKLDKEVQIYTWVKKESTPETPAPKPEQKKEFDFDLAKFQRKELSRAWDIQRVFRADGKTYILQKESSNNYYLDPLDHLLEPGGMPFTETEASTLVMANDGGMAWVEDEPNGRKSICFPGGHKTVEYVDVKCLAKVGDGFVYGTKGSSGWMIQDSRGGLPIVVEGELERISPIQGSDKFAWVEKLPDGFNRVTGTPNLRQLFPTCDMLQALCQKVNPSYLQT